MSGHQRKNGKPLRRSGFVASEVFILPSGQHTSERDFGAQRNRRSLPNSERLPPLLQKLLTLCVIEIDQQPRPDRDGL